MKSSRAHVIRSPGLYSFQSPSPLRMAQLPRKSSASRNSVPTPPAEDLFAASDPIAPEPSSAPTFDDSTPEEWLIEDNAPASLPAKPISLPSAFAPASPVPQPQSAYHLPSLRADGTPSNVPPSPAPADRIPQVAPATRKPERSDPTPIVAETHDPFEINEELPPVPASSPAVKVVPEPTSRNAAFHEAGSENPTSTGSSSSPVPAEHSGAPAPRNPASWLGAAAILAALVCLFIGVLYTNRPTSDPNPSRAEPRLPLSGQIATLPALDSGWRTRQPGDLVSTVEITLPVPSRQPSELVPQVQFTIDPAATKTGFLRFIFLDPDGKISGDVRVLKVSGGTIDPLASGGILSGTATATVYGSLGFMDRPSYVAYATGPTTRWSVEISESTDSNAREEGWTKLETFELRNASAP